MQMQKTLELTPGPIRLQRQIKRRQGEIDSPNESEDEEA
jgi:hypothetical protein